jgi:hypothetical protein
MDGEVKGIFQILSIGVRGAQGWKVSQRIRKPF